MVRDERSPLVANFVRLLLARMRNAPPG